MTDILREVEEELRREKMESVAKRWGPILGGVLVAAILTYAGYEYWQVQRLKQAEIAAVQYDAALKSLEDGKVDDGIAKLDAIAKTAPGGLKALAIMQKGAALSEKGDEKAAAAAYTAAAAASSDPTLKELAILKAAYSASTFETRAQIDARLTPLIASKDSAFGPLARELSAMMAWTANDFTAARALYSILQLDPKAPEGVRTRASRAVSVIDAKAELSTTPLPDPPAQGQQGMPGGGQQLSPEMISQMQAAQAAQAQAQAQAIAQARAQQAGAQKAQDDRAMLQAIEQARAVAATSSPSAKPGSAETPARPKPAIVVPPAEPAASPASGNTP